MADTQNIVRNRQEASKTDLSTNTSDSNKNPAKKSSNGISSSVQILSSIVLGFAFGFFMNKSNVHLAPMIREQMLFKRLTMIKMFLGAVGTSMLSVFLIILLNQSVYTKTCNAFIHRNNRIGVLSIVVGGSLIGVGMVLAGSCPGTVFIQLGSGLPNAPITFLGGMCGVLFYYLFLNQRLTSKEVPKSSIALKQLPDLIGVKHAYLNLLFGLTFLGISFTLEHFIPYKKDVMKSGKFSTSNGWSPAFCGVGIGVLQLFFMIIFNKSLGISTGFTVLVAQLCRVQFFKKLVPSLESFVHGVQNNVTLLFSIAAVVGSFIAALSTNQFPLNQKYGADVWSSFFGGFLLLVGARCAGGCTSGQGISGVSHLLIGSLIATAAMFGGGIFFAITYGLVTNDWKFRDL